MKLLLLRSVWSGSNKLDELIEQTIAAGFNGIEGTIPRDESEQRKLRQCLSDRHLAFIAEATTYTDPNSQSDWWILRSDCTITDHLNDLKWTVDRAEAMGALFVSTMCGYDAWSWQQNVDFFGQALELERTSGITISFETHQLVWVE